MTHFTEKVQHKAHIKAAIGQRSGKSMSLKSLPKDGRLRVGVRGRVGDVGVRGMQWAGDLGRGRAGAAPGQLATSRRDALRGGFLLTDFPFEDTSFTSFDVAAPASPSFAFPFAPASTAFAPASTATA